jgi:AraC-like DNA-binding protein
MRTIAHRIGQRLRRSHPSLYISLVQRPAARLGFKDERALMKGTHSSNSDHKSCVLFTVHRGASTYVSKVLNMLAEDCGMTSVNFASYFALSGEPRDRLFSNETALRRAFGTRGYFYGPFRWFHDIPAMESYAVLLVLRDPRDVMTSHYYSTAYSHALLNHGMIERRKTALRVSVDEYVLRERSWFKGIYEEYCQKLLGKPNVLFLKYEDMVADFEPWLRTAAKHLGFESNERLLRRILEESDFRGGQEDAFSHRRQVTPGDHRRKLLPETVEILTADFRNVLEQLGYVSER